MNNQEIIESKLGRKPGDINAEEALLAWYGENSIACHLVRPVNENFAQAYFVVPENLCGRRVRPPMFDGIRFENGVYQVQTSDDDAREHFIDDVPLKSKIIPGHNQAGLIVEVATSSMDEDRQSVYLSDFDFIRYKDLVLPGWEISLDGPLGIVDDIASFSPRINRGKDLKTMARNFRCQVRNDRVYDEMFFDQHWLLEAAAQALGIFSAGEALPKDKVPVFLEVGKAEFTEVPIRPGDILSTWISILSLDDKLALAEIRQEKYEGVLVGLQHNMLVGFLPMIDVQNKIENLLRIDQN